MSKQHPIVAVTGASGAGTTVVKNAFKEIFYRQKINAAFVSGECFFRYSLTEEEQRIQASCQSFRPLSIYGPQLNDFYQLQSLFAEYAERGSGRVRRRISAEEAFRLNRRPGDFSDYEPLPADSDLLFYEGLHGAVVANSWTRRKMSGSHNPQVIKERRKPRNNKAVDVAQYADLLIGVVPAINLEWIQKIHQDTHTKCQSTDEVSAEIVRRLQDYIYFMVPQFSLTDINFQRMPVVDTSNPFDSREVPNENESIVVVRFREPKKYNLPQILERIDGAFMSRSNTMVIKGGQMQLALDVICSPIIEGLLGWHKNS